MRYEDLIDDPATTLDALLTGLGLEPAEAISTYLAAEADALFSTHGTSSSPRESLGRWRREIPPDDRRRITGILEGHLRSFGYPVPD